MLWQEVLIFLSAFKMLTTYITIVTVAVVTFLISKGHGGQTEEDKNLHAEISLIWDVTKNEN